MTDTNIHWRALAALGATIAVGAVDTHAENTLSARDAGARFGQALGAVEICIGSKTTEKANALQAAYAGDDLEIFKTQAARVLDAWLKVKSCAKQDDPNQCKIMMDKSCAAAAAEIGAAGSVIPGLLEFPKR
ncbi:MAG: hypothetical protein ACT4OU_10710 [Hyphomicrobium sp.]